MKNKNLTNRPPVVVVMGHIDHGKSTLLDFIRKTKVVEGEVGGITQHLGAYEVEHETAEGEKTLITFLDTPGHEAFQGIRSRGSKVADIAILVVSAEDGVKPQTLEALKAIKEANIPYIVAINKIDKPNANAERTKQNLAEHEIYIEGYGGDVPAIAISALKGQGVTELLDMIILMSQVSDLRADPTVLATGLIIEANIDKNKGSSATLIIKNGHIRQGMYVVSESAYSPVRIFEDYKGNLLKEATFSSPVKIIGWNEVPHVGAEFSTVETKKEAEEFIRNYKLALDKKVKSIDTSMADKIIVPLVIKTDVIGSLEGIHHELAKIKFDKVAIKIVAEGIGNITENDIKSCLTDPETILIAFGVNPDQKTTAFIEKTGIKYKNFNIIYELSKYINDIVVSKVPKEFIEESTGKAKVLAIFSKNKDKQIIGCKVQEGSILLGAEVKILRRDIEIGKGKIKELQQQKQKAEEVREGYECGMLVESKVEIALGDKIECFKVVEKKA